LRMKSCKCDKEALLLQNFFTTLTKREQSK